MVSTILPYYTGKNSGHHLVDTTFFPSPQFHPPNHSVDTTLKPFSGQHPRIRSVSTPGALAHLGAPPEAGVRLQPPFATLGGRGKVAEI